MNTNTGQKKYLYLFLGFLFLLLTYIGILLPGLPAIPFILLAAFFFTNSSRKMYDWMLRQRFIGSLMKKTSGKKGRLKFILLIISHIWLSVILSLILVHNNATLVIISFACGIGLSFMIYFTLRE
jgi:uncharacterized protein